MIAVSVQILISSVARLKKKIKHGLGPAKAERGNRCGAAITSLTVLRTVFVQINQCQKNNRREHWGKMCPLRLWNVSRFSQEQWRKKKKERRRRVDRKPFSLSNGRSPVAGQIGWV
jgi:hypothetical protein